MSVQTVEEVLQRAAQDPTFRGLLKANPDGALHGYDISYAERAAIIAGDEAKLEQLGVSRELSRLATRLNEEGDLQ